MTPPSRGQRDFGAGPGGHKARGKVGMVSGCSQAGGDRVLLQPQERGFAPMGKGLREQVNLLYLAFTCTVPSSPSCQT